MDWDRLEDDLVAEKCRVESYVILLTHRLARKEITPTQYLFWLSEWGVEEGVALEWYQRALRRQFWFVCGVVLVCVGVGDLLYWLVRLLVRAIL